MNDHLTLDATNVLLYILYPVFYLYSILYANGILSSFLSVFYVLYSMFYVSLII